MSRGSLLVRIIESENEYILTTHLVDGIFYYASGNSFAEHNAKPGVVYFYSNGSIEEANVNLRGSGIIDVFFRNNKYSWLYMSKENANEMKDDFDYRILGYYLGAMLTRHFDIVVPSKAYSYKLYERWSKEIHMNSNKIEIIAPVSKYYKSLFFSAILTKILVDNLNINIVSLYDTIVLEGDGR